MKGLVELHGGTVSARSEGVGRELRPEVILCDIGLPDVDGYHIARTIRAEEALRSTRLIALSGYALPEDRRRAKEAGFDAHIGKPPALDALLAAVVAAD